MWSIVIFTLRFRLFWLKLIFGNQFPENRAFGCAVKFSQTENVFSLTKKSAKNDWNWFQSLFSLQIVSSPLSHAWAPHTRTVLSSLHCSNPHTEPNGTTHTDAPRSRSRRSPELRRSTLITIAIAPIGVDRDHRNQRDCDRDLVDLARSVDRCFARSRSQSRRSRSLRSRSRSHRENMLSFWVLFEFLGMNDIMCLFGSWENVSNK